MTRDLLTPSVSTVASKYVVSIATNIIRDRRTTLTIEMLEALTCLKDWQDGCIGLQTLEDELKKAFKKLDLNSNNDVQEIDDDSRWKKKNEDWMKKQMWIW